MIAAVLYCLCSKMKLNQEETKMYALDEMKVMMMATTAIARVAEEEVPHDDLPFRFMKLLSEAMLDAKETEVMELQEKLKYR